MLGTVLAGVGLGVDEVEVADHDAHPFEREQLEHAGEATLPDVPKRSAGLLVYRWVDGGSRCWSGTWADHCGRTRTQARGRSPRASTTPDEPALDAARREFEEELGLPRRTVRYRLGESVQRSGKVVTVWAVEGDVDLSAVVPGTFTMEWPRGSGRVQEFPELDRFLWFTVAAARDAVFERQRPFLDRLARAAGRCDAPSDA